MINIEMLEEMFDGDKEFISVLFTQYLEDNSGINEKIQSQFDANQLSDLFHTTHTLAGALSNICETDTVPVIKKIELLCKQEKKPSADDIELVKVSLVDIFKQMQEYLKTIS